MSASEVHPAEIAAPARFRAEFLLLGALVLLTLVLFWPSIEALAKLWSHPERRTYQHGYAIAAIVLWLLYRDRNRIADAAGSPSPLLLLAAACGGILWAIAWNAGLQVAHFIIWPAILWAAAAGALGWRAGRAMLFPFAFLYFAMPVWELLTPGLQFATVLANRILGALVGVPMMIEDTYIHIPEGTFEISGGCSGLNYLVVGLAISALLGELNREKLQRRIMLVTLGGGLALVSNWLRVFIIVFAGHVTNMTHYLVRVNHYNFGWVLYAFVLAAFFLMARRMPRSATAAANVQGPSLRAPRRLRATAVVGAFAALALGPVLAMGVGTLMSVDVAALGPVGVLQLDPDRNDAWLATPASGNWVPVFPGADAESLVQFSRGNELVTAYTATYLRQRQGRELIGFSSLVQGAGRGRLQQHGTQEIAGDPPMAVLEAEWRAANGDRALLWWTYQVGSLRFTSSLPTQLWYGVVSLWDAPVSSVVILRSECLPDCDRARIALREFSPDTLPKLVAASTSTGG